MRIDGPTHGSVSFLEFPVFIVLGADLGARVSFALGVFLDRSRGPDLGEDWMKRLRLIQSGGLKAGTCLHSSVNGQSLGSYHGISDFTASWTFSKARSSIWRTRSRETPNSVARSASVIGSSTSRRASKMRRSRLLSTVSASPSALRRLWDSSLSASRVS